MLGALRRQYASQKLAWYFQSSRGAFKKGSKLAVQLDQDVQGLGSKGDQVLVNHGYAHNWLLPQKLAAYDLSGHHKNRLRAQKTPVIGEAVTTVKTSNASLEQQQFESVVARLLSSPVNVKRKMRKAHIIEGQVTAGSIVDAVARQKRIGLEREVVMLKKPIIELGTFNVPLGITLANGEQASLTVVVGP